MACDEHKENLLGWVGLTYQSKPGEERSTVWLEKQTAVHGILARLGQGSSAQPVPSFLFDLIAAWGYFTSEWASQLRSCKGRPLEFWATWILFQYHCGRLSLFSALAKSTPWQRVLWWVFLVCCVERAFSCKLSVYSPPTTGEAQLNHISSYATFAVHIDTTHNLWFYGKLFTRWNRRDGILSSVIRDCWSESMCLSNIIWLAFCGVIDAERHFYM